MFHSTTGFLHTLFALLAMAAGLLVILLNKGTRRHKLAGWVYVSAMIALNVSAFYVHVLYQFGPFHYMAIFSLLTVLAGVSAPLLFRSWGGWLRLHYDLMLWSYVGLMAAFVAEVAVRLPFVKSTGVFWLCVAAGSFICFAVGGWLIGSLRKRFIKPS